MTLGPTFGAGVRTGGAGLRGLGVGVRGFGAGVRGFEAGLGGFDAGVRGFEAGVRGFEAGVRGKFPNDPKGAPGRTRVGVRGFCGARPGRRLGFGVLWPKPRSQAGGPARGSTGRGVGGKEPPPLQKVLTLRPKGRRILGSFWDRFGILLGSFWDRFGIVLGSLWNHFGIVLGSCWDHLGIF